MDWQFQREAAAHAVASVSGVRAVSNDIVLREHSIAHDIEKKIHDSFRRNADIDAKRIQVATSNNTVTLTGTVRSWTERDDAGNAAYSVRGVAHVKNLTTVS